MTNYQQRYQALTLWLTDYFGDKPFTLVPLLADASFRRYFRLQLPDQTYIAMDAPPELEDSQSFVWLARAYQQVLLRVPHIYRANLLEGYLLIEDLGDALFGKILNQQNVDQLYISAIDELIKIQDLSLRYSSKLPSFDGNMIQTELKNFQHWFLEKHLGCELTNLEQQLLASTFEQLVDNAMAQPQVGIHRDYHSRNLLLLDNQVAMVDFQDSAVGPITYDIVSLIRDCYIDWPEKQVNAWLDYFYQLLQFRHKHRQVSFQQMQQWFDWMGMQRHLKAIFIFARKYHRDGNSNYLPDIDRALSYVTAVLDRYPELAKFKQFTQQVVLPRYQDVVQSSGVL
jgi:aminoglycoside/choline kinase family phosphotransferase